MIELVTYGPKLIAIRSAEIDILERDLMQIFCCERMEQLGQGIDTARVHSILCLTDEKGSREQVRFLAVQEAAEYVLCHIMNSELQARIRMIRALPQSIIVNTLGKPKPIVDKISSELQCERICTGELLRRENREGVLITFLTEDNYGARSFYDEILFVQQDFAQLAGYLKIHAPRFLAKAFEPDVWHMVDLRIFDRYEAYELQYKRIIKAIDGLKLGYIVTETWNREVSMFTDPVGTYHIRLLTFLSPLELKKLLIGLEYSSGGNRIVDLDMFWHGKKLSWKHLLDDKEIRRSIKKTADFFPKSSFFAVQNDKVELIQHCVAELKRIMPAETSSALMELEKNIYAGQNLL